VADRSGAIVSPPENDAVSVPWFGARKFARRLVSEVERLTVERDDSHAKTQKVTEIARNLVA
jgi:hypothetical protein